MIGILMCVTSFAAGCVFMKARQLRNREVADTDRQDVKRILGGLHSRPLVGYPAPLSPRDFDGMVVPPLREAAYTPAIDWYRNEHRPLTRGWWVEKAQRVGTRVLNVARPVTVGRHSVEATPATVYLGVAQVDRPKGEITQAIERILDDAKAGVR